VKNFSNNKTNSQSTLQFMYHCLAVINKNILTGR